MRGPVVSPRGADGLRVGGIKHLLLAEQDQGFADAITMLLRDQRRREAICSEAAALVRCKHGAEGNARQFEQVCIAASTAEPMLAPQACPDWLVNCSGRYRQESVKLPLFNAP